MSIKCNSKDLLWSKNHYLKNSSNFRGVKTTLATMSILSANCSTFLSNKSGKQPLKCTKMCVWWPQIDLRRWKVNQTNRNIDRELYANPHCVLSLTDPFERECFFLKKNLDPESQCIFYLKIFSFSSKWHILHQFHEYLS